MVYVATPHPLSILRFSRTLGKPSFHSENLHGLEELVFKTEAAPVQVKSASSQSRTKDRREDKHAGELCSSSVPALKAVYLCVAESNPSNAS